MKNLSYIFLSGFILLLCACSDNTNTADLFNNKASLPGAFDFDKLGLKVMTSFINKKEFTMATLYANDTALKNAVAGNKQVTDGEVFALVTWKQQADKHWFGGNIPAELQSIELVKTGSTNGKAITVNYQNFEGQNLALDSDTSQNQVRIKYIMNQQPAIMP